MESGEDVYIGDIQDISEECLEQMEIESFSDDEFAIKGLENKSSDDVFNLNISIAVLESETDEIDVEFHDALVEIKLKGKNRFPVQVVTRFVNLKAV